MKDFQKQLRNKVYSMRVPEKLHLQLLRILDREDPAEVAEELLELLASKLLASNKNDRA